MKLLFFGLLGCLLAAAWAGEESDMYFESSGEGMPESESALPVDDEDTMDGGSGETAVENSDEEEETEVIEIDPNETGEVDLGKTKNTRIVTLEDDGDRGVEAAVKENPDDKAGETATASSQFVAAVVVGGCIGLLFAICVIMLLVYRMRKKDEGSYALEYGLDKKPQGNYEYTKGVDSKEYFA